MDIASHYLDAEMVVTTGDNFYDNGVASVEDPFWNTSFEQIYKGPNLFIDWHPTLGNHDYRGNWQAQIDYSQVSRRWQLPAQYYEKLITLENGTQAHLLFIDTSPLNPDYKQEVKYKETQKQNADVQLAWINQRLSTSKAAWKIVFGHHPLYSSGKRHGTTDGIRSVLEPVLEKHGVHAYFAGHEHDLQHNHIKGKTVEHFISGAGSKLRPTGKVDFTRFSSSSAGFASLSIGIDALVVQFISDSGKVVYRYNIEGAGQ
jgi:tartrate-resistant acid phosphatase type 5